MLLRVPMNVGPRMPRRPGRMIAAPFSHRVIAVRVAKVRAARTSLAKARAARTSLANRVSPAKAAAKTAVSSHVSLAAMSGGSNRARSNLIRSPGQPPNLRKSRAVSSAG